MPVGYIEAKDISVDLKSKSLKEQFDRYKVNLTNLMFTDYLDFHFYKEGQFVTKIAIASIETTSPFRHPQEEGNLGKVFINETQYFENVPEVAWNFYIGGYQPAQKWLKDRKDRTLSYEDIFHYQKIIVALTETDRIMKELDAIKVC